MLFHQLFLTLLSAVLFHDEEEIGSKPQSEHISEVSPTLKSSWSLWYDLQPKKGLQVDDYRKLLQKVGSFNSISGFWNAWHQLFENIPDQVCNFQVFKEGVEPIWEHESNIHGGKWIITKGSDARVEANIKDWLSLVLSMIAGGLGFEDDICGAVLSVRNWGISITIWNRDCHNQEQINQISERLKNLLGVEYVRYQPHQTSLKRNVGAFQASSSHRGYKNAQTRSHSHSQLPHQQQHGKQSKKKVERVQSAPAVLPSTPKSSRHQQPQNNSNKKDPLSNQSKKRRGKKAQAPKEMTQNEAAISKATPSVSVNSTAVPLSESKQPTKRSRHQKKKGMAKMEQRNDPSSDDMTQKLSDFVKPLTSIDKKIGISLLIGATLTAMYIL